MTSATRDERGSGSLLTLGVAAVLTVLATAVAIIAGYLIADRRAAGAADLAALAAARAQVRGEDACAAARATAIENRSKVRGCSVRGAEPVWVAEVSVTVDVRATLPRAPRTIARTAWAGTADAEPDS